MPSSSVVFRSRLSLHCTSILHLSCLIRLPISIVSGQVKHRVLSEDWELFSRSRTLPMPSLTHQQQSYGASRPSSAYSIFYFLFCGYIHSSSSWSGLTSRRDGHRRCLPRLKASEFWRCSISSASTHSRILAALFGRILSLRLGVNLERHTAELATTIECGVVCRVLRRGCLSHVLCVSFPFANLVFGEWTEVYFSCTKVGRTTICKYRFSIPAAFLAATCGLR